MDVADYCGQMNAGRGETGGGRFAVYRSVKQDGEKSGRCRCWWLLEEKVCGKFEWRRYVGAVVVNCVYVK